MAHSLVHALVAWVLAHPSEVVAYGSAALMALVSQLPAAYARKPVVGFAVRVLDRFSVLTHHTAPGTLKWPGVPSLVLEAAQAASAPQGGA